MSEYFNQRKKNVHRHQRRKENWHITELKRIINCVIRVKSARKKAKENYFGEKLLKGS